MATTLKQLVNEIGDKIELLGARCGEERDRRLAVLDDNQELKAQVGMFDAEIERLRRDIEFLSMSYKLAQSPDDVIAARRHIAGLIRDIEKCISKLKE